MYYDFLKLFFLKALCLTDLEDAVLTLNRKSVKRPIHFHKWKRNMQCETPYNSLNTITELIRHVGLNSTVLPNCLYPPRLL